MCSINPLFSIVASTITITTIAYTFRLFLHTWYVTHPCNLSATPDPLLHSKPDPWRQAKSNPSQIHCYKLAPSEARLSERWEWAFHHYKVAPSEARLSERWEWEFHHYQLVSGESRSTATSEACFTPNSKARSTATSLLPAKPDPLLPAKPVSPLTVKPDPPLQPCSQWSQVVREVRVSIPLLPACFQRSQIHSILPAYSESRFSATSVLQVYPDSQRLAKSVIPLPAKPDLLLPASSQRCQIHCYHLAPSEARLSERWEWACQSGETKHIRAWKVNMSELCEWADQWWKWACQSWSGSEYVRVVRVSMSELWEWACWSHESQSVCLWECSHEEC